MEKKYHVYAIGNALVDTEVEVSDDFLERMDISKGVMTLVDEAQQAELLRALDGEAEPHKHTSGGSAANTVIATQYFGGQTYYSCKVADDADGDFYVRDLMAAGVNTNMNGARPEGISGKCLVMITPDAERTMHSFLGISASITANELDPEAIRASEYVYLEGYLVSSETGRDAAIRLRRTAEESGVKTALTFSDPAMVEIFRDGLVEMLGDGVDLLFCNEAEACGFTGRENPAEALEELKRVARGVVITRGARGAWAWDGQSVHEIPAVKVNAIDTNGAGDMFAGAFLYAITHGHGYDVAGKLASQACARLVTEFGARLPAEAHDRIKKEVLG